MSEHNKEVTADKIGYFPNEQGDYTVTYNDEPFCVARFEKEAKWIVREFRSIIEREREDALQSSPAQEVEKPDFKSEVDRYIIFLGWDLVGTAEVNDMRRLGQWLYKDYISPLLKENQSLKDRVKELEQEAFFIKLHRDSAQEDASSLRAIIKSLEAENEELRKKIERDNDRLKGYTD